MGEVDEMIRGGRSRVLNLEWLELRLISKNGVTENAKLRTTCVLIQAIWQGVLQF